MIVNNEIKAPCADPEEMKMYLEETSKGLIFDLAHAMISANYIGADRIEYIKKFLKLKPMHFHISGQDLKSLHDEHRALHECDIDWYEILRMFPKDAEVTMEVSQDVKKTAKDLSMIRNVVRKIA
jgi:sugar phosphate isomerase/epimerase